MAPVFTTAPLGHFLCATNGTKRSRGTPGSNKLLLLVIHEAPHRALPPFVDVHDDERPGPAIGCHHERVPPRDSPVLLRGGHNRELVEHVSDNGRRGVLCRGRIFLAVEEMNRVAVVPDAFSSRNRAVGMGAWLLRCFAYE